MRTYSALIVEKARLPDTATLFRAIADHGAHLSFPGDFRLDRRSGGWVSVQLDGEETGFDYGMDPLGSLIGSDDDDLPPRLTAFGDHLLGFEARGRDSAIAVAHVQWALAERWGAAGWIEEELLTPDEMARDCEAVVRNLAAALAPAAAMRDTAAAAKTTATPAMSLPPQRPPRSAFDRFMVWWWLICIAAALILVWWKTG